MIFKKILFVSIVLIVVLISAYCVNSFLSNQQLEQDVISYVIEEKSVDESDILATNVYNNKGSNVVGIFYDFDRDHIYMYYKSQVDENIIEDGKREITSQDNWVNPFLE